MTPVSAPESSPTLQVKVSIVGSEPAIWRLLEVDSSLTLDRIHDIIQAAVGWRDFHLHSFTDTDPHVHLRAVNPNAGDPRSWVPPALLEDSDDDLPEAEWALGTILTEASGPLFYEYDFGDGWTHRLELVGRRTAPANAPRARLIDGERRAPLEDSGGIGGYHHLLEVLADPSHAEHQDLKAWVAWSTGPWQEFAPERLDLDAANDALSQLFPNDSRTEASAGRQPMIQGFAQRMPPGIRREFLSYLAGADLDAPALVEADVAEEMTAPYLWLICRLGYDGVSLTAAGWLPPAVVHAAMTELGWDLHWPGKANREELTPPVFQLRESAQQLGLIRKFNGKLVLSNAAKPLLDRPQGLWLFIAQSLAHRHRHEAEQDATLLLLLEIANGKRSTWDEYLDAVAFGLTALGWTTHSGEALPVGSVLELIQPPRDVLQNLGVFADGSKSGSNTVTPEGQVFARAALQT